MPFPSVVAPSVWRASMPVAAIAAAFALRASAAGLLEVDQTVFGMDCSPCAYSVEQGLKKLKGVTRVEVSLNQGKAMLVLAPDNEVTLAQIHALIRDAGFTPKEARIRVAGTVELLGDRVRLIAGRNSSYRLMPAPGLATRWPQIKTAPHGTVVEVVGEVQEDAGDPPLVIVKDLRVPGPRGHGG